MAVIRMKTACTRLAFSIAAFLWLTACSPREFVIDNETLGIFAVQVLQAAERRDVKGIAENYAETAVIDIQLAEGTYPFTGTLTRSEYSAKLAELLKNASSYKIDWSDPQASIAEDKKSAKATIMRKETFVMPEGIKEFQVKETMELALIEQRIVLTRQTFSPAP